MSGTLTLLSVCLRVREITKKRLFVERLVLIWRLECLCDNVARFFGRGVIDVCETKGKRLCGEIYDVCMLHDSDTFRYQKLHFLALCG